MPEEEFKLEASFEKIAALEDQRLVYGWAYCTEMSGQSVVDHSGDVVDINDLEKAAHAYMKSHRAHKVMHYGKVIAETVESVVFSKELQSALGIDLGKVGWFVVFKILDDETWDDFKSGKYPMLSIGGMATREKYDEQQET